MCALWFKPVPERPDLVIACSAPVIDQREVTSSNGESEMRYVIETSFEVGGKSWPIEITLTNRAGMQSHMLVGRQALLDGITVSATDRFCQPELSYDAYLSGEVMRKIAPRAHCALPCSAARITILHGASLTRAQNADTLLK